MSNNTIPKNFRRGNKPSSYMDLDPNIKFVCSIVNLILDGESYIGGSYKDGIPALNSDIDIYVPFNRLTPKYKEKINVLSNILGVKIDLGIVGSDKNKYFKIQ